MTNGPCGQITWGNMRSLEGSRYTIMYVFKALRSPAAKDFPIALFSQHVSKHVGHRPSPISTLDHAIRGRAAGLRLSPTVTSCAPVNGDRETWTTAIRQPSLPRDSSPGRRRGDTVTGLWSSDLLPLRGRSFPRGVDTVTAFVSS